MCRGADGHRYHDRRARHGGSTKTVRHNTEGAGGRQRVPQRSRAQRPDLVIIVSNNIDSY